MAEVRRLLEERHGTIYRQVSDALESADPMDIVYPNNPGEYEEVVWEILAQLESDPERTGRPSEEELTRIVDEALGRLFESRPDPGRVKEAVVRIDACLRA